HFMENQRIPWRSFLPLLAFCLVGRAETPLSRQSLDLSALIEQSRAERAELSSYRTKPLPEVERAYDQAKRVVRFADDVRNYYRLRFATRKIDGVWRKLAVDAQGEPVNTYIDGIESLRRPPVTEFMYVMDGKGNFYLSH